MKSPERKRMDELDGRLMSLRILYRKVHYDCTDLNLKRRKIESEIKSALEERENLAQGQLQFPIKTA